MAATTNFRVQTYERKKQMGSVPDAANFFKCARVYEGLGRAKPHTKIFEKPPGTWRRTAFLGIEPARLRQFVEQQGRNRSFAVDRNSLTALRRKMIAETEAYLNRRLRGVEYGNRTLAQLRVRTFRA